VLKKLSKLRFQLFLILSLFIALSGCSNSLTQLHPLPPADPGISATAPLEGSLKIHFLDVGQADSLLIQAPSGKTMLIDAGNNADDSTVVDYIRALGISRLDIVVGTHPHEDHIGGLDTVIETFDIGQIVMPNKTHTTRTFEDVITAVQNKGLKITAAKPGVNLNLGSGVAASVIAPLEKSYEDLNNYSAVIHLSFGNTSFLFTGDAEEVAEADILQAGTAVQSTVLKVGHHGSRTSSSSDFLQAVHPDYAVILCGQDNDYGHPHQETLDKLSSMGVQVYRTDVHGTIIATSDGKTVQFKTGSN
jgi:beta-lactamase superfamily II metal-dependent hydrolase